MFKTRVITDESQVPAGYISMIDVRKMHGEPVARALSDAHTEGKVQAVKLMRTINDRNGPVWVDMHAWNELQRSQQPKPKQEMPAKFQGTRDKNESPWDELVSMSFALQSMDSNMGRIAEALEAVLQVQRQTLASMQRLETAWAGGERSS